VQDDAVESRRVVLRVADPRRRELETDGWQVVAETWGARLGSIDESRLTELVDRVASIADVHELGPDDLSTATDVPAKSDTVTRRVFGAVADGTVVARSVIDVGPDGADTVWTVVEEEWRGCGLGTAVKAASVLALAADGVTQFRTAGPAESAAVITANLRMGYVVDEEWVTLSVPSDETPGGPGEAPAIPGPRHP
jgi:hypothetical protein